MDIIDIGRLCEKAGYEEVKRNHFFFEIFKEEKENMGKAFFMKKRKLFFNILVVEHPFSVDKIKLFEIPLSEIETARKQKLSMPLHVPPDKGYLPNHEGEEAVSVLSVE